MLLHCGKAMQALGPTKKAREVGPRPMLSSGLVFFVAIVRNLFCGLFVETIGEGRGGGRKGRGLQARGKFLVAFWTDDYLG